MKARWRQHEKALVSIIAIVLCGGYVAHPFQDSIGKSHTSAGTGLSVNYFTHILFPQITAIILLLCSYLWLNRIIANAFKLSPLPRSKWLLLTLQMIVISYLIGPGINIASFYVNPHYMGDPFGLPLGFGYHPQPLLNIFGGWFMSCFLILVYGAYALLRETLIMEMRKVYVIEVSNQITSFFVVLFATAVFIQVFAIFNTIGYYYAFTLSAGAVFFTNKYALFPVNFGGHRSNGKTITAILFTSFGYTIIFSVALGAEWTWPRFWVDWLLQLCLITPMSWLNYQKQQDKILALRGMEKALVKSEADMQFLRMQINPHFLFNALNTLYGTALTEGAGNAAAGIQKLGDMMRFMLHDNTLDSIPMSKEVEYLENYIALQKLRTQLSPQITIEDLIMAEVCQYNIAPMLLIPLVENAFKHGIHLDENSWINIKLECTSNALYFQVRNSVHTFSANNPEKQSTGIGLHNVQSRLQLLYAGEYEFNYGIQGQEFVASLTIKFQF